MLAGGNKGFTLIELVIVIVLLGILAATALPKFADLSTQAKKAAAQGVAGSLASGIAIAHAQWIASAKPSTITMEGTTFAMTANGWVEGAPTVGTTGTATAAKCLEVFSNLLNNPPQAGTTCVAPCVYKVTAATPVCSFQDDQGTGANTITYNISTGAVTAP